MALTIRERGKLYTASGYCAKLAFAGGEDLSSEATDNEMQLPREMARGSLAISSVARHLPVGNLLLFVGLLMGRLFLAGAIRVGSNRG